jgi:hypothetical protein
MSFLSREILATAGRMPEGQLLMPKQFVHFASRAAVDQTLTRLVRDGRLLRVGRGLYTRSFEGRFGNRPPSVSSLLRAVEEMTGEVVVTSGVADANRFGLTTQVPVRQIFLTGGSPRTLHVGGEVVEVRRATRWEIVGGNTGAGRAIRALGWVGPAKAAAALADMRPQMSSEDWEALCRVRGVLPSWMAAEIGRAEAHG